MNYISSWNSHVEMTLIIVICSALANCSREVAFPHTKSRLEALYVNKFPLATLALFDSALQYLVTISRSMSGQGSKFDDNFAVCRRIKMGGGGLNLHVKKKSNSACYKSN